MGGKILPRIRVTPSKVLVEVDAELGNKCVFKWLLGKTIFFFFFLTGNTPSLLCGLEFANIRVDG